MIQELQQHKKFGTGSLIFDGSDYIQAVNTEPRELFTPATGDMTWECFVKFDILDGDHCLFSKYGVRFRVSILLQ